MPFTKALIMNSPSKIQSFLKPRPAPAAKEPPAKQTLQEFHAAGGGVPTQYKGREHVWHAMVDKFAAGGAAQPAANIDGNDFVKAAQANGLKTDNATLNKIVARVNRGESVQEAAKNVAQSRADGGEVHMAGAGDPAFYPRVGNIKSKNFKPVKPPPLVEDPRAMNLPQYGDVDLSVPTKENLELGSRMAQRDADLKRQREGDRSLPEKIAGGAQAGRFIGSALTQAVNSLPTRMAYGDEAADKFMQERLYKPEQPTAYEYVDDVGNFLERLETELKIPPVLPEATALQYLAGPAASQAKKAAGQGALSLAKSDAAYNLAQRALASPALAAVRPMNVVKPTGGNFLTGRTQKDLQPLKRPTAPRYTHINDQGMAVGEGYGRPMTADELERLNADPAYARNEALNNWVDSNLTNYVQKQMGTADDPVRKLAEQGITHKPALLDEYLHEPLSGVQMRRNETIKNQRTEAGFPEEGMGQSPLAKAWELASDESIAAHRAGDIQGMPERFAKFTEAENKMRAARSELDEKFKQHIAVAGLNEREEANLIRGTAFDVKAKMVGDTDYAKANTEYLNAHVPMMDNYMELGRQNPYINKLAPETPMYAPFTGDLGFDHIMDVLREDVTAGRLRPEQLSKVSMEQAVRRTFEYDQELAAKANASRAAAREGLPTYREYPEGYRWVELNKPGSFSQESEAMGHSVRGYEPPKGHPDWTEASGDAGSSGYGHGGWEAIKSGKAKVYSLVDSKGAPHATVETKIGGGHEYAGEKNKEIIRLAEERGIQKYMAPGNESLWAEAEKNLAERGITPPQNITQIKGKGNRAPNEEYLPYIQDFVRGGKWSDVNDLQNTGMRPKSSAFNDAELRMLRERGETDIPHILSGEEIQRLHNIIVPEGKRLKYDAKGNIVGSEEGMAAGGAVRMGIGGAAAKVTKAAAAKAGKKVLGAADEVPKGVEPIVVRTPEERAVIEKFGQKQQQEAARKKKVEKADKAAKESAGKAPEESGKPPKSTGKRVAVPPDVYRRMAETQGDEAVLKAARAGKHLKPIDGGYIGAPRTVTSGQGLGAMRKGMDTDFADAVEAVRLADPERLGTWYDRAKQGIAESSEPYQLPRTLEQHAVYSAGVSPESELTFALKHLNSRVAGEPGMAYRGAGMRNLDEAVAEGRPANLGFKIGEYGEKNDPRLPNTGLFGVNDFRRAQGMTYTDPQGNPWKAGVSDTMHPFMDAETALQVDRANTAGTGGRTDWQGPHIQEVPWVYGKAQDLHSRGLKGRYAGDELEGIKQSLRDANNTARDYFYKNTGSATHEAIPGASTGHVPQMIDAPYEQKVAYGNIGRWDMPAPEYALSDMGTVGAGNRDAIYGALGYRQLPTIEASGAYFPEGSKIAEHQPVKIARPLLDFPTGGGGLVAEPTRQTMNFAERFRALGDAQEAFGYNLPNTMANVKGKNSLVLDTRGANPRYLDEPHTGVMPNETQMGALSQALGDVGYGVAPTSRGATVFPFDSKATAADARQLMKDKGSTLQQIYPSEMEPSLNTSGYGPGVGMYTPQGFQATEPFSGQATMGLLKEASYLPPDVAINLGESELVRSQLKAKMKRDAALPNARADIQETRRFFSEADWPKAVALIRQGYTPAAALIALGYSASSMAEDRR